MGQVFWLQVSAFYELQTTEMCRSFCGPLASHFDNKGAHLQNMMRKSNHSVVKLGTADELPCVNVVTKARNRRKAAIQTAEKKMLPAMISSRY